MPLAALAAVSGVTATGYVSPTMRAEPTDGSGFATSLAGAVDAAQALQAESKTLALQAVTGNLDDIHNATLASTRAQVTLELVAAVRNKGVDAFTEIMRMQA
ncbi:flagellar hook-basal body complex protein FliE [Glaciibacter psychrotolerans]|uniref:Flagellar hook-basal body complex protein FliE n=1 Tax=Glaciibacter psychrotolerans TaxID=670054 RepID=A0A7Z0J4U5_9MICO|nr:flagellar hook-basal body complex protein FliE [Leifsonia psychrotolerans]NYJ18757.1 flagellar hook-basal body complex protein FliE [Leifsonia psychrotolerans]